MYEILLPLAGTTLDEAALPHALAMAQALSARVHLVKVLEASGRAGSPVDPISWHVKKQEGEAALERAALPFKATEAEALEVVLEGDATERLLNYVSQNHPDVIVLAAAQGPAAHASVSPGLLHRSYVTTLLIRGKSEQEPAPPARDPQTARTREPEMLRVLEHDELPTEPADGAPGAEVTPARYHHILVTLDGSRRAECALSWARHLAEHHGAAVTLAHVVVEPDLPRLTPPSEEDRQLVERLVERNFTEGDAYLHDVGARLGFPSHRRLLRARKASPALFELCEEAEVDLVIMSAHGYGGESHLPFGDVATSFIDHGTVPLLLVQDMQKGARDNPDTTSKTWSA